MVVGPQKYKYCVFHGNYPQYIRSALLLREGPEVEWLELEPSVEAINVCDFIWKPFNFAKNVSKSNRQFFRASIYWIRDEKNWCVDL